MKIPADVAVTVTLGFLALGYALFKSYKDAGYFN